MFNGDSSLLVMSGEEDNIKVFDVATQNCRYGSREDVGVSRGGALAFAVEKTDVSGRQYLECGIYNALITSPTSGSTSWAVSSKVYPSRTTTRSASGTITTFCS